MKALQDEIRRAILATGQMDIGELFIGLWFGEHSQTKITTQTVFIHNQNGLSFDEVPVFEVFFSPNHYSSQPGSNRKAGQLFGLN